MYNLRDILNYTEQELDNFLKQFNVVEVDIARKRYWTMYYLYLNNLFDDEIINLSQDEILKVLIGKAAKVVNVKIGYIRDKYQLEYTHPYQNLKEWCDDPMNIYIGRKGIVFVETPNGKERYPKNDSIWANPFKLKDENERTSIIEQYRTYIFNRLDNEPELRQELKKLNNCRLGCWCKTPDKGEVACHGDVLLEAIQKYC